METKTKTKTKEIKEENIFKNWEFKDRTYILSGNYEPLTYTLPVKHTRRYPLLWFDESKGYNRELRYATNQKSPFVDEQKGPVTLSHLFFEKGVLIVKKDKPILQQFLSLHPQANKVFYEHDNVEEANNDLEYIEMEVEALNLAMSLDIDHLESIMRVEIGSSVSNMSTREIKRDALLLAKRKPSLFVELATDDHVQLRNIGIIAVEKGILNLSGDNRTFSWGSNNRKLFNVPFDEHPYSALAAWFKTDEGLEVFKNIEKKLK
tara:strand:+ start:1119 stop:1907 length:789 start_codon:yes stop_codon:yes gene_type:complete